MSTPIDIRYVAPMLVFTETDIARLMTALPQRTSLDLSLIQEIRHLAQQAGRTDEDTLRQVVEGLAPTR